MKMVILTKKEYDTLIEASERAERLEHENENLRTEQEEILLKVQQFRHEGIERIGSLEKELAHRNEVYTELVRINDQNKETCDRLLEENNFLRYTEITKLQKDLDRTNRIIDGLLSVLEDEQ